MAAAAEASRDVAVADAADLLAKLRETAEDLEAARADVQGARDAAAAASSRDRAVAVADRLRGVATALAWRRAAALVLDAAIRRTATASVGNERFERPSTRAFRNGT